MTSKGNNFYWIEEKLLCKAVTLFMVSKLLRRYTITYIFGTSITVLPAVCVNVCVYVCMHVCMYVCVFSGVVML